MELSLSGILIAFLVLLFFVAVVYVGFWIIAKAGVDEPLVKFVRWGFALVALILLIGFLVNGGTCGNLSLGGHTRVTVLGSD